MFFNGLWWKAFGHESLSEGRCMQVLSCCEVPVDLGDIGQCFFHYAAHRYLAFPRC